MSKLFLILSVGLVLLLVLNPIVIAEDTKKKGKPEIQFYADGDDPLLYGYCKIENKEPSRAFGYRSGFNPRDHKGKEFIFVFFEKKALVDKSNKIKKVNFLPLYPIYLYGDVAFSDTSECYFRIHKSKFQELQKKYKLKKIHHELLGAERKFHTYNNHDSSNESIDFKLSLSMPGNSELKVLWRKYFKKKLLKTIKTHKKNSLEVLLFIKFFNEIPALDYNYEDKNSIFKVLGAITGLNDIKSAIPVNKKKIPEVEEFTLAAPKMITLPHVATKEALIKNVNISDISKWVPRSCYFFEFNNFADMTTSIEFVTHQLDQWLFEIYPKRPNKLFSIYLRKLGVTKEYEKSLLKDKGIRISVFGWDPYYQSGTSVGLVLHSSNKIKLPENIEHSWRPNDNTIILCTSPKLLKMSKKCFANKSSMNQVDNFRYARNLFTKKKGEKEYGFLYLSDYWLMNFISPRWKILNERVLKLDARIKLIHLLKGVYNAENGLNTPISLEALKSKNLLTKEFNQWLFADLSEDKGVVKHKILGSLFQHPPIDLLDFKLVSKREKEDYESFRREYEWNWKEMDPLAFQIVKTKKGKWKSRLYISPISNISGFREIASFVLKEKVKHTFEDISGQAAGFSIAIKTSGFNAFGVTNVSLQTYIQLLAFDFAPSSFQPSVWLKEKLPQDLISYFRAPAFLVIPSWVLKVGFVGNFLRNSSDSEYKGLQSTHVDQKEFPLFKLEDEKRGKSFLSFNPVSLCGVRDKLTKKAVVDDEPSDIHAFVDFKNGYSLRKKMMQELVKNRGLAAWSIKNQHYRINKLFGNIEGGQFSFFGKLIIPAYPTKFEFDDIPIEKNGGTSRYPSLSSKVIRSIDRLPPVLTELKRADVFISIFENSLLFETHYEFNASEKALATKPVDEVEGPEKGGTEKLDFDDD